MSLVYNVESGALKNAYWKRPLGSSPSSLNIIVCVNALEEAPYKKLQFKASPLDLLANSYTMAHGNYAAINNFL